MTSNNTNYAQYDDLRSTAQGIPLVSNDASHVGRNLHQVFSDDENTILCHVPIILRWTGEGNDDDVNVSNEAYGGSAAALLAMHHFNTGDSSIIDEFSHDRWRGNCPIRLTAELIDSKSSGSHAMQELTRILTRNPNDLQTPQPCALFGSSWSSVTKKLATVSGVYDLPHTTSSASSVDLDDPAEYPFFTRTHPSDASMAKLSVDYLSTQLDIHNVAIFYVDNDYGNSYHLNLLDYAAEYNMTAHAESYRDGASDRELEMALQRLANTGYRYILGVFFAQDFERIMTIAHNHGIIGPGYFWMFNGALASQFINGKTTLNKTLPIASAPYGHAILTDEGGLPFLDEHHDRFLAEWNAIGNNAEFLQYFHSKIPTNEFVDLERSPSFFQDSAPSHIAAFSYDAIASLALSACQSYRDHKAGNHTDTAIFSGFTHHLNMVNNNIQFKGASGDVIIASHSFSREAESTLHVVSNILQVNATNETVAYQGFPFSVFDTMERRWMDYSQSAVKEFVYSDNSTVPPAQLPPVQVDYHHISSPVRAICLSLAGLAMLTACTFWFYFGYLHSDHRVVRASQPVFLGMICFGCILLASTIIPLSFDDSNASGIGTDAACIFRYWLCPIGFCIIFSALFSKLWRVNRLIIHASMFQRVQIRARDVMVPFCVLLGLNCVVLTVWTAIDPLYWDRNIIAVDSYNRIIESSGECASNYMDVFIGLLLAINGCALILALWQAWIGRGMATEFSESKYIAMATVCIFQALFLGIPITVIVQDQPTAQFFVASGIILIICFSILLLIFVPKYAIMHNPSDAPEGPSSSVSMHGRQVRIGSGSTHISHISSVPRVRELGDFSSVVLSTPAPNSTDGADLASEKF